MFRARDWMIGSGWMLAWQVFSLAAAAPFVALPLFVQARESLIPGRPGALSLGTFAVVASVSAYFTVVALVNGFLVARGLGWRWGLGVLAGLAAASASGALAGMVMHQMAGQGGALWVWGGSLALCGLFMLNLSGPVWALGGDEEPPLPLGAIRDEPATRFG